jgi:hypothetical protein
MFGPHDDRREDTIPRSARGPAILGFVVGAGLGWLIWYFGLLPLLEGEPTQDNPSGGPSEWIYYGSLVLCLLISLFVVAVIGEWLGKRRRAQ